MHVLEDLTDDELARRASTGDHQAFDVIFNRSHARVYGLCYRFLGSHHDTEDVVQEVFIKVAGALPGYEGRSSFQTWLYRITFRTACDRVRSLRRAKPTVEFEEQLHGPSALPPFQSAKAEADAHLIAAPAAAFAGTTRSRAPRLRRRTFSCRSRGGARLC